MIKDSYVEQFRILTDHLKRFFNGECTTFVKTIQTTRIEAYFEFEEKQGKVICQNVTPLKTDLDLYA